MNFLTSTPHSLKTLTELTNKILNSPNNIKTDDFINIYEIIYYNTLSTDKFEIGGENIYSLLAKQLEIFMRSLNFRTFEGLIKQLKSLNKSCLIICKSFDYLSRYYLENNKSSQILSLYDLFYSKLYDFYISRIETEEFFNFVIGDTNLIKYYRNLLKTKNFDKKFDKLHNFYSRKYLNNINFNQNISDTLNTIIKTKEHYFQSFERYKYAELMGYFKKNLSSRLEQFEEYIIGYIMDKNYDLAQIMTRILMEVFNPQDFLDKTEKKDVQQKHEDIIYPRLLDKLGQMVFELGDTEENFEAVFHDCFVVACDADKIVFNSSCTEEMKLRFKNIIQNIRFTKQKSRLLNMFMKILISTDENLCFAENNLGPNSRSLQVSPIIYRENTEYSLDMSISDDHLKEPKRLKAGEMTHKGFHRRKLSLIKKFTVYFSLFDFDDVNLSAYRLYTNYLLKGAYCQDYEQAVVRELVNNMKNGEIYKNAFKDVMPCIEKFKIFYSEELIKTSNVTIKAFGLRKGYWELKRQSVFLNELFYDELEVYYRKFVEFNRNSNYKINSVLSKIVVEINKTKIVLSSYDFSLILLVKQNICTIEGIKKEIGVQIEKYKRFCKNLNNQISNTTESEICDERIKILVENKILTIKDNLLSINKNIQQDTINIFEVENFDYKLPEFVSSLNEKDEKLILRSLIMKTVKREKKVKNKSLIKFVGEKNRNFINICEEVIENLIEKGFINVKAGVIFYIP